MKTLVFTDFFFKPALRRALIISIGLHLSQQITGIGSVSMLLKSCYLYGSLSDHLLQYKYI